MGLSEELEAHIFALIFVNKGGPEGNPPRPTLNISLSPMIKFSPSEGGRKKIAFSLKNI
jgi:hypothetical protein